jgi:hypothetical protein
MIAIPAAEGKDSAFMAAGRRILIMIANPGSLASPAGGEPSKWRGERCSP